MNAATAQRWPTFTAGAETFIGGTGLPDGWIVYLWPTAVPAVWAFSWTQANGADDLAADEMPPDGWAIGYADAREIALRRHALPFAAAPWRRLFRRWLVTLVRHDPDEATWWLPRVAMIDGAFQVGWLRRNVAVTRDLDGVAS